MSTKQTVLSILTRKSHVPRHKCPPLRPRSQLRGGRSQLAAPTGPGSQTLPGGHCWGSRAPRPQLARRLLRPPTRWRSGLARCSSGRRPLPSGHRGQDGERSGPACCRRLLPSGHRGRGGERSCPARCRRLLPSGHRGRDGERSGPACCSSGRWPLPSGHRGWDGAEGHCHLKAWARLVGSLGKGSAAPQDTAPGLFPSLRQSELEAWVSRTGSTTSLPPHPTTTTLMPIGWMSHLHVLTDSWSSGGEAHCGSDQWLSRVTNSLTHGQSLGGWAHGSPDQWLRRTTIGPSATVPCSGDAGWWPAAVAMCQGLHSALLYYIISVFCTW